MKSYEEIKNELNPYITSSDMKPKVWGEGFDAGHAMALKASEGLANIIKRSLPVIKECLGYYNMELDNIKEIDKELKKFQREVGK